MSQYHESDVSSADDSSDDKGKTAKQLPLPAGIGRSHKRKTRRSRCPSFVAPLKTRGKSANTACLFVGLIFIVFCLYLVVKLTSLPYESLPQTGVLIPGHLSLSVIPSSPASNGTVLPLSSPVDQQALNERKAIIKERRDAIRQAMIYAWGGYTKYAWGKDDLRPVAREGNDWLHLGLTMVDALDTLFIMELYDEFQKARDWVADSLNFQQHVDVSIFETTIRTVGGLLSAYDLSKDKMFLEKAHTLARILLHGFETPTGIPKTTINLGTAVATNPSWSGGCSILSEVGTVQLEFTYLARHVNDPELEEKALQVIDQLVAATKNKGLYPVYIHPSTGQFSSSVVSLGALGDSFYEYLMKMWLLFGGPGTEGAKYREYYDEAMKSVVEHLVKVSSPSKLTYLSEYDNNHAVPKMDELACFAGAMFAMGASRYNSTQHPNRDSELHMHLAKEITRTCYEMWTRMPSGLAPEFVNFVDGSDFVAGAKHFLLRPETLESMFILWRLTHDPIYQDWGWDLWLAIDKHCKCAGGGYSGILNVVDGKFVKDDSQPSYFLAETLKYLYLLYSPDDLIPLDKYVFNTEAHPLSIFN
ncbi:mannosyl-oligosaccharide 1,2-alpha-mannosidase [Pelomyxa schiedti]|nr:mannosyl-oligosaccharide 1,2-alpha-mannosidase [Pelomyxa schiedti]